MTPGSSSGTAIWPSARTTSTARSERPPRTANLQYIIEWNEDPEQKDLPNVTSLGTSANQIAAAKTLQAFYYMNLTDILGPIVISEAFKGSSDDIWTPKYDTQKEVYDFLDKSLNEAYALFDTSGNLNASADANYGGDIAKWKKLNASLRMIAAIKLSDVDPATGKSRFAKAYSDGGMTAASDGLFHTHSTTGTTRPIPAPASATLRTTTSSTR